MTVDLADIPYSQIAAELARRNAARRKVKKGRKKVLRACPKCNGMFGARELRKHKPGCAGEAHE